MLTLKLMEQTIAAIVDGDGRSFADFGELLRRRTAKFAQLQPSLLDSFDTHGPEVWWSSRTTPWSPGWLQSTAWSRTPVNFLRLGGDSREELKRDWERVVME
jgi:hypothetical protein